MGCSPYCCELFYSSICLAKFFTEEEIIISILILGYTDYVKIIRYSISFIFATFFAGKTRCMQVTLLKRFQKHFCLSRSLTVHNNAGAVGYQTNSHMTSPRNKALAIVTISNHSFCCINDYLARNKCYRKLLRRRQLSHV